MYESTTTVPRTAQLWELPLQHCTPNTWAGSSLTVSSTVRITLLAAGEKILSRQMNVCGLSPSSVLMLKSTSILVIRDRHARHLDVTIEYMPVIPCSTSQPLMLTVFTARKCAFYINDTSISQLQARFDAILSDIKENPIAFYDLDIVDYPAVVTIRDLQYYLLVAVYNSVTNFSIVASIMAQLEHRNASTFVSTARLGLEPESSCDFSGLTTSTIQTKSLIQCHDADGRYILDSVDEWAEHVSYLVNQSAYAGAAWAFAGGICQSYDVRAPPNQVFRGYKAGTKTATPMLFVRNTLDPVTPAAKKMRRFFDDSALLTLDAVGHPSIGIKSQCMSNRVRNYFENGDLPEEGLVCEADVLPFLDG